MNMSKSVRMIRGGAIRALAATALGMSATWVLAQPISDIPLPVKNNVPPNFMFMIDSSSSMHNITVGEPYAATATYALDFTCNAAVQIASGTINLRIDTALTGALAAWNGRPTFSVNNGATRYRAFGADNTTYARRCFNPTATYTARLFTDAISGGGVRGHSNYGTASYSGHFLNWYFSANGSPSGTTNWINKKPTTGDQLKTRIEISKAEAKLLLTNPLKTGDLTATPKKPISVRVGLSQYYDENNTDGGALLVGMGDFTAGHKGVLETAIDNLVAKGSTPLAETHGDIGRYMATGYSGNVTLPSAWSGTSIDDVLKQGGASTGRNSCLASGIAAGASRTCTGNDAEPAPATGTPTRPIQYWCQRSYAFLLTDGLPTKDAGFTDNTYIGGYAGQPSTRPTGDFVPNYFLKDVSKALFDLDLRPNLVPPVGVSKLDKSGKPFTNLRTYTFGFGDADVTESPLLKDAATLGGGLFVGATSRAQLQTGFRQALADAFSNESASAAVNVVSSDVRVSGGVGYAATYQSGQWYGDLEAYQIATTGARTGTPYWSAKAKIDTAISWGTGGGGFASRKIASFDGVGRAFTSGNFPQLEQTAGVADPAKAGLVDYLRGSRSKEGGEAGDFRVRQHALGDTVNARPLVVDFSGVPIVFQGANDGMLHVIDGRTDGAATNGIELWAYVPQLVHANLSDLASQGYNHRYYVDAGPVAAEVSGVTRGAATVSRLLVGGLGKGGRGYYALDISAYTAANTAAAANKAMWEFGAAQTNMGYSFGQPLIINTAAGWRVLVTSGYDNGTALGGDGRGYMWMLDPATGTVLKTYATGVGTTGAPSGLAHLSVKAGTAPGAAVRYVYGGDLYGNVWRFDLDATSAGDITPSRLATLRDPSNAAQPITAAVQVGPVDGSASRVFVYVGTGRYLDDQDVPGSTGEVTAVATQPQSLYGLIDDMSQASPTPITVTRSTSGCGSDGGNGTLACQDMTYVPADNEYDASRNIVDLTAKSGWYVDWPQDARLSNARVTGKPGLTSGGTLVMTVNVPAELRCQPGGRSWLFALYSQTGGAVPKSIPGNEYNDGAGQFLGDALASEVVVLRSKDGAGKDDVTVQGQLSNSETFAKKVPEPKVGAPKPRLIYWRSVR
jgi:type IV pilus assembly protein PilY1